MHNLKVLVLIVTFTETFILRFSVGQCTSNCNWFGVVPYLCHCATDVGCDVHTGECPSACADGWFGPACQYVSSKYSASDGSTSLDWLTDNDDATCNDANDVSTTVSLDKQILLSWMTLVVKSSDDDQFEVTYVASGQSVKCGAGHMLKVDSTTLEISCPSDTVVSQFSLSGSGTRGLCSLYISAGRNVALGQPGTAQSSTYNIDDSSYPASLGVDGLLPSSEFVGLAYCTHTLPYYQEQSAWWSLTFADPVSINSVSIYNRVDCCVFRLVGFTMNIYDESDVNIFTFTEQTGQALEIFHIYSIGVRHAKKIEVVLPEQAGENILTLCEVLVYGDVMCADGTYGLQCENLCNCDNGQSCFASTGGCPSSCSSGANGEICASTTASSKEVTTITTSSEPITPSTSNGPITMTTSNEPSTLTTSNEPITLTTTTSNEPTTTTGINSIPIVTVLSPPSSVVEGTQQIILNTTVTSDPAPTTVSWLKGRSVIDVLTNTVKYGGGTLDNPSLTIYNVDREDDDVYTCEVVNSGGIGSSPEVHLNVVYLPTLTVPAQQISSGRGEDVLLTCIVDADPVISNLAWFRVGGVQLSSTSDPAKFVGGTVSNHNLTILNTEDSDAGDYFCQATNDVGTSTSQIVSLTVSTADWPYQSMVATPVILASIEETPKFRVEVFGYPAPEIWTLSRLMNGSIEPAPERHTLRYIESNSPYGSVEVILQDLTTEDFTTYIIVIDNGLEELNYTFTVYEVQRSPKTGESSAEVKLSVWTLVAIGVSLGLVLVLLSAFLIHYIRRTNTLDKQNKAYKDNLNKPNDTPDAAPSRSGSYLTPLDILPEHETEYTSGSQFSTSDHYFEVEDL